MTTAAWEELSSEESRRRWAQFEELYGFRASTRPDGWPAIREPLGSVTFDLDSLSAGGGAFAAWSVQAVNALVLRAFAQVTPANRPLVVLDWQHPTYHLWLTRAEGPALMALDDRPTPVPDGDYYIFLTEDMTEGTFGHPWEGTLCVFGERLSSALVPCLQPLLQVQRSS